jgi:UDP-glucose 6-dehydrogenase
MQVGIIGHGFVGGALESALTNKTVSILDKKYPLTLEEFKETEPEIIFLCLPTPTVDGCCDDLLIVQYVEEFKDSTAIVVVKSTIPPSTVEKILQIRDVVIWPELLREAHADYDMRYPEITVIGSVSEEAYIKVKNFILYETKIKATSIQRVQPIEASIFKYMVNSFLATKVLFMHQAFKWMESRGDGGSWNTVAKLLGAEGRVGHTHLKVPGEHGFGFAGTCFPKDTEAFLEQVYHKDLTTFPLLDAVVVQNKQIRNEA